MKLKNVCGLAVCFSLAVSYGGNVYWQAVGGNWDGNWSDPAHWGGALPAGGDISYFLMTDGGTVSVPAPGVTTQAEFAWQFWAEKPSVLDATGSSFTMGPAADGFPYSIQPWYCWLDGITFGKISYNVSAYETIKTLSVLQMNNAKMALTGTRGVSAELVFSGYGADVSSLDLCDPVGGRKTGALPSLEMYQADLYQTRDGYPTASLVFKDLTSVIPSCVLYGYPLDRSRLAFSGGKHTVLGTLNCSETMNGTVLGETRIEATDAADVTLKGEVRFPQRRRVNLLANAGATLNVGKLSYGGATTGANFGFSATGGATLDFQMATTLGIDSDVDASCVTAHVHVADAALKVTSNQLNFGNPQANDRPHTITAAFTNATVTAMNAVNGTSVNLYNGTVTSRDSDWTVSVLALQANNPFRPAVFTFDGGTMDISNRLDLINAETDTTAGCTNLFVQKAGTIRLAGAQRNLLIGKNNGVSRYELKGGTLAFSDGAYLRMADTAGSRGELIVDGEDARVEISGMASHFECGRAAGAVSVLQLKNGEIEVLSSTTHRQFVPHYANATGIVEVTGGSFKAVSYGLGATYGTAIMDFKGGETWLQRFAVGTEYAVTPESVVTVSGGTLTVPPYAVQTLSPGEQAGIQITGNKGTNRFVRLRLLGGTVNANRIVAGVGSVCNGGTGWTVLEGDGGLVKLNGTGYQMFNGFDEARLGEKGLTIDSNGYAAHIYQNFKNKQGAAGRLILTGTGEKTLYGAASEEAELVAAGGTVTFAEGARHASALTVTNGAAVTFSDATANGVTALTLGDGTSIGTLNLTAGTTVCVNGPVSIRNVRVMLSGAFETGSAYTLLTSTEPFDADSKAAWAAAVAHGLGETQACDLTDGTDAEGRYILGMTVREAEDLVITVESGTSNVTENIVFAVTEQLRTVVAEDATLNLQGDVLRGGLVKEGDGRTILSGTGNAFRKGLTVSGGLLSGTTLSALGFGSPESGIPLSLGTATLAWGAIGESGRSPYALTVNTTSASDAAVLLCRADVTMDAPVSVQGCVIKRGPGRLVYETDRTVLLGTHGGTQTDKNANPPHATIVFDENGIPPTVQYTTLNVAEGELVLKGTGGNAHFRVGDPDTQVLASTYIGMPVKGLSEQARLTVDGARATLQNNAHFHLGSGCKASTSDALAPSLVLTNGAVFTTTSFQNGYNADGSYHGRIFVDASTLDFTEYIYSLKQGTERAGEPTWLFTNGSRLLSPNDAYHAVTFLGASSSMVFDRSVFEGRATVANGRGRVCVFGADGTMVFRNGSVFRCDTLVWRDSQNRLTLTFDDGAWDPADGDYTFSAGEDAAKLTVNAAGTGRGLVLAPPDGTVWTMAHPVSGEGGVTKEGAGTLVFTAAPTCAGALDVTAGTVSFDGLSVSGLTLKGTGTVAGGTLADTTYAVTLDENGTVPARLAFSGVTFDGRTTVDLGRTDATAFGQPYPADVTVATYTGTAPDVSGWRTSGTGSKKVTGTFTAADGEIRMTLSFTAGTTLLFR